MFRSSSERYKADCDWRFRMHYRNGYVHEQSERNKSLFPVDKPIVFEGERRPDEHLVRIDKIQAVGALRLPSSHSNCIYQVYIHC